MYNVNVVLQHESGRILPTAASIVITITIIIVIIIIIIVIVTEYVYRVVTKTKLFSFFSRGLFESQSHDAVAVSAAYEPPPITSKPRFCAATGVIRRVVRNVDV